MVESLTLANQMLLLIRTLGISLHLVVYRGDNWSCRVRYSASLATSPNPKSAA
jgi:hypothetical protein